MNTFYFYFNVFVVHLFIILINLIQDFIYDEAET
jgi:hypothetical protein